MKILELKKLMYPFTPFILHLSDGAEYPINHTDYIFFPPPPAENKIIIVDLTGGIHLINTEQIVEIQYAIKSI